MQSLVCAHALAHCAGLDLSADEKIFSCSRGKRYCSSRAWTRALLAPAPRGRAPLEERRRLHHPGPGRRLRRVASSSGSDAVNKRRWVPGSEYGAELAGRRSQEKLRRVCRSLILLPFAYEFCFLPVIGSRQSHGDLPKASYRILIQTLPRHLQRGICGVVAVETRGETAMVQWGTGEEDAVGCDAARWGRRGGVRGAH